MYTCYTVNRTVHIGLAFFFTSTNIVRGVQPTDPATCVAETLQPTQFHTWTLRSLQIRSSAPLSTNFYPSLFHRNLLERINSIALWIIQLKSRAILHRQTILLCIIQSTSSLSPALQAHLARLFGSLDPEADINAAMDLVDFTLDPRVL